MNIILIIIAVLAVSALGYVVYRIAKGSESIMRYLSKGKNKDNN